MKRKRGHKKGKSKKKNHVSKPDEPSPKASSPDVEENSDRDDDNHDNIESNSAKVAASASPSLSEANQPEKAPSIYPERPIQRPVPTAVYGRVKVRLKTPKVLDAQVTSSDAPAQSTDVNGRQAGAELQSSKEKIEDSANLLPGIDPDGGEKPATRPGSIKIISSKGSSSSSISENMDARARPVERPHNEEPQPPQQDSRYNKQELDSALEVIKKVMKMEAAEPFNVPVNPIELGIPDYFDVIDTPMDFGTIRENLESGSKYRNSEDVYKDVQYVWGNCYKYNNKGDYVVDLMKRVKKNFSKYWSAAGLYTDHSRRDGSESIDGGDPSSHEKKQKKGKGVKKHKDGCLCAICVMKRRRREREAREAHEAKARNSQSEIGLSDSSLPQREGNTNVGSPFVEETSSYMETSQDNDVEAESEDIAEIEKSESAPPQDDCGQKAEGNETDTHDKDDRSGGVSDSPQGVKQGGNESEPVSETKIPNDSSVKMKADTEKQQLVLHYEGGQTSTLQHRKQELMEAGKKRQRVELYESFQRLESPLLIGLCSSLFSNKGNSPWRGPHSLIRHNNRSHLSKNSKIHGAVASFMTPVRKPSSS